MNREPTRATAAPDWCYGVVYVCPERDIECGNRPANWCEKCPQRPSPSTRKGADKLLAMRAEYDRQDVPARGLMPSPSTGGEPEGYAVYFVRRGSGVEDKLLVAREEDAAKQVEVGLIRRVVPLFARGEPATDSAGRKLREAAKEFYNATVADTAVRISSDIEEKRDIAAAAANRLRDVLIATREPAPVARDSTIKESSTVARELDVEAERAEGAALLSALFKVLTLKQKNSVVPEFAERLGRFMFRNGYRVVFNNWHLQAEPETLATRQATAESAPASAAPGDAEKEAGNG